VEYNGTHNKVTIICPIHGEFWQTPENHIQGKGCPKCSMSHLETEIMRCLEDNQIEYVYECNKDTLPWIKRQTLDFYLPKYDAAIECQGSQHFIPTAFGSKEKTAEFCFENIIKRDKRKKSLCKKNNVKLLYYSNLGIEYPYQVFENKEELLKEIINE
jgi:protein-arginine kinase activator protein McsA